MLCVLSSTNPTIPGKPMSLSHFHFNMKTGMFEEASLPALPLPRLSPASLPISQGPHKVGPGGPDTFPPPSLSESLSLNSYQFQCLKSTAAAPCALGVFFSSGTLHTSLHNTASPLCAPRQHMLSLLARLLSIFISYLQPYI